MSKNFAAVKERLATYQRYSEGGREFYFYPHYLIFRQIAHRDHLWHVPVGCIGLMRAQRGKWYLLAEDDSILSKEVDRFLDDSQRLGKLEQFIASLRDATMPLLANQNFSALSDDALNQLVQKYYDQFEQIFAITVLLRVIDRAVVWRLKEMFKNDSSVDAIVATLSSSQKPSFAMREEQPLLKIARTIETKKLSVENPEVQSATAAIYDQFCWSSCGYYNEPAKTREEYTAALRDILRRGPRQVTEEINDRLAKGKAERDTLFQRLSKTGQELATLAAESAYLKDSGKFVANEMAYRSHPLFVAIAARTGQTVDFIKNMLPQEVEQLLAGRRIKEDMIQRRLERSVLVLMPGETEIQTIVGKEAIELETAYFTAQESIQTEWRGRAASPGFGRGRVRVVLGTRDFGKFEVGDILVATNTSPDFVPIMKKAAAIIAEDGGITAHASVASREMGIPAVVGVTHATQILRDGDEVEVDADKGIVRKL